MDGKILYLILYPLEINILYYSRAWYAVILDTRNDEPMYVRATMLELIFEDVRS